MRSLLILGLLYPVIVQAEYLGDHLFKQKTYYAAITEYKRALFFEDREKKADLLYAMANAYYDWGKLREAEDILLQLVQTHQKGEVEVRDLILLAKIHWDSYNYESMRAVLDRLFLELSGEERQQVEYVRAWTYIYQAQWEEGIEILRGLADPQLEGLAEEVSRVYKVPQKSVLVAALISTVVPGSGQLYAGDYVSALYSFLLVGFIGTSMIWDFYQKAYFTAMVKYVFLYRRYSKGSIHKMQSGIVRDNVSRIGDFLKGIADRYPKPMDVLEGIGEGTFNARDRTEESW